jgi:DNA-binding transcriptional LysR family regulator
MLLRQLEYFVAVAKERHFARAADACYVSQPALSEAIRKLEKELDVSLIRRGHAFEGLTPEGERLVVWAKRILADHDALQQEVSAMRTGLSGELHVGLIPAAATTVAQLVDAFAAAHPLVSVHLHSDLPSTEIIRRLRHFELDAALLYADQDAATELDLVPLYEERHVLLAPPRFVGDAASITWAEAAQLPLCLLDTTMHGRRIVDSAFATAGVEVAPQVQADSIAALTAHVATGRWASIVPHPWVEGALASSVTRVLELTDPSVRSSVGVATSPDAPRSLMARAFVACARTLSPAALLAPAWPLGPDARPIDG